MWVYVYVGVAFGVRGGERYEKMCFFILHVCTHVPAYLHVCMHMGVYVYVPVSFGVKGGERYDKILFIHIACSHTCS